ncbi:hypothetical protein TNCV_3367801 [Trichonephila clavipes]|nr:hypothetical protein TNCV_3367801 [Trichonephila clavipes]
MIIKWPVLGESRNVVFKSNTRVLPNSTEKFCVVVVGSTGTTNQHGTCAVNPRLVGEDYDKIIRREKDKPDKESGDLKRHALPPVRSNSLDAQLTVPNAPRYARLESDMVIGQAKEGY